MKKFYGICLLFLLFVCQAIGQKKQSMVPGNVRSLPKNGVANALYRTSATCDTINIPVPDPWTLTVYSVSQNGGFLTGVNRYNDLQKAAYFNVSNTSNTRLNKAYIYFAFANTNTPANLTKVVPINVYDGTGDEPGALLGTVNKTLQELKDDVDNERFTEVVFPSGIALPASKKFLISVDLSNLKWNNSSTAATKDSVAIVSTTSGDELVDDNGYFFEQWDDGDWYTSYEAWETDLSLAIFPIIGTSADCSTLPVTLVDFSGERQPGKNILTWKTRTEQNNKGFEIERSADGVNFTSLGFVGTKGANGNSTASLTYTFDDLKPFKTTSYYRLKQVDKDGRPAISPVVMLKGSRVEALQISNLYPNPAKSFIKMLIASPASNKVSLIITDLAGRRVLQQTTQLATGDNMVELNIATLAQGSYMIKAICANGCETAIQKFVKQ